jgi:hypothetical protein
MDTVPPNIQPTSRDHSLITFAVLAVLIAALVALPFLGHTRHGSQDMVSPTPRSVLHQ